MSKKVLGRGLSALLENADTSGLAHDNDTKDIHQVGLIFQAYDYIQIFEHE